MKKKLDHNLLTYIDGCQGMITYLKYTIIIKLDVEGRRIRKKEKSRAEYKPES